MDATQNIDIANVKKLEPTKEESQLFAGYTNAACDAAKGIEDPKSNALREI